MNTNKKTNWKMTIASGLTALVSALTPSSAYTAPPAPALPPLNAQGQICLLPNELETYCKDTSSCPPAPQCPSKKARPRIPRSNCTDYYKQQRNGSTGDAEKLSPIGICLHTDDANRLQSLEGAILEKGPDNLCPWGESYHCYGLDIEKVEKTVEKAVKDPETERLLKEARRHIHELEQRKPAVIRVPGPTVYVKKPQTPEHELSVSLGVLAQLTSSGVQDIISTNLSYLHPFGEYFVLGIDGRFFSGSEKTKQSLSTGQELLPDGNFKNWTDINSRTQGTLFGGVGSIAGMRVPVAGLEDELRSFLGEYSKGVQLYSELLGGLYAIWRTEESGVERTTSLVFPDGTPFLGPKTISEPQGKETIARLGLSASAALGLRIPLGRDASKNPSAPALTGSIRGFYFYIPGREEHYLGGEITTSVQF